MRFLSTLLSVVLAAGVLFAAGPSEALAGTRDVSTPCPASTEASPPVAAQPGTDAEAREYEQREAASPEVQEFSGGEVVIGVSVVVLILIVVLVILLSGN